LAVERGLHNIQMTVGKRYYFDFCDFRLDVEKRQLLKNGEHVQLTHKTFQILELLVSNSGHTTRKDEIFERLWPDNFVEEGNLTQHIHVLRKVLGRRPDEQSYIETVPRQGYRFTLQPHEIVVIRDDRPDAAADESGRSDRSEPPFKDLETSPAVESEFLADADGGPPEPDGIAVSQSFAGQPYERSDRPSRSRLFVIVALLALGLAAAFSIFYYFRPRQSANAEIRSIAVLPFKPIGGEIDTEKLGLGVADAVIARLSKLPRLEVRPTSAIFPFVDHRETDSIELGRQLDVDAVLEGTVQREADQVKVSIQLLEVADGLPLLAESYYEKANDIFVVQDVISKRIVATLSLRLAPQQESLLFDRITACSERPSAFNRPAAMTQYLSDVELMWR
jgi:DNA-binding winged helix-turn-helix (wHTH) protein/TolB-like protein